jgi:hypothetical protein
MLMLGIDMVCKCKKTSEEGEQNDLGAKKSMRW